MVEGIEINIGKELAGQISNRQAAPAFERREQIIAGKMPIGFHLRITAIDDFIDQPKSFCIGNDTADNPFQNFMVDAGRYFEAIRPTGTTAEAVDSTSDAAGQPADFTD